MHATQYIYHKDDDWNEKQMAKKREVERASRRRERREREEHEMAMRRVKAQAVAGGAGAARTSSLKHSGEMSASGRTPKQQIRASSRATKDDDAASAYLDDDDDDVFYCLSPQRINAHRDFGPLAWSDVCRQEGAPALQGPNANPRIVFDAPDSERVRVMLCRDQRDEEAALALIRDGGNRLEQERVQPSADQMVAIGLERIT